MSSHEVAAVYGIPSSPWHDEAEACIAPITSIINEGDAGSVPTELPPAVLEITDITTRLLQNGYLQNEIVNTLKDIIEILEKPLDRDFVSDADHKSSTSSSSSYYDDLPSPISPISSVSSVSHDAAEFSEPLFQNLDIVNACQPHVADGIKDQPCIIEPPPVPPKRRTGSVAAARAALAIKPLASRQESPPMSDATDPNSPNIPTNHDTTPADRPLKPSMDNGNTESDTSIQRRSRNFSEVSRIESIMDEIDGFTLQDDSKPKTGLHRRVVSENNTIPSKGSKIVHFLPCAPDDPIIPAGDIKLAKARREMQQWRSHQAQQRITKDQDNIKRTDASSKHQQENNVQLKTKVDAIRPEQRRATFPAQTPAWVTSPSPVFANDESLKTSTRKVRKAKSVGGPRWKAPF